MITVKDPSYGADDFWNARPNLAYIRDYSRARLVSPWATFGCVLARTVAATTPAVKLPAIVGAEASLNLFVAIVGLPGNGKGAAERSAEEITEYVETVNVGSGEGLPHLYAHRDKESVIRTRDKALISVGEIDTLAGIAERKGQTILPELRKAWMGESLGFQNADPKKRLHVDKHSYRLCLIAGVQPGRAGVLLNDAGGGTPQRFLWFPAIDPDAPDTVPAVQSRMLPLTETPWSNAWDEDQVFTEFYNQSHIMDVCGAAKSEIRANRLAVVRGEVASDDGHRDLARLKAAAAISIMSSDDPGAITEEDWQLAAEVMKVSDAVRNDIAEKSREAAEKANRARAHAEADRAMIVDEKTREHHIARVAKAIQKKRAESLDMTDREIRRKLASRDRPYFDEAVQSLS